MMPISRIGSNLASTRSNAAWQVGREGSRSQAKLQNPGSCAGAASGLSVSDSVADDEVLVLGSFRLERPLYLSYSFTANSELGRDAHVENVGSVHDDSLMA